jgi:DNA-binding response OmpR family regulator
MEPAEGRRAITLMLVGSEPGLRQFAAGALEERGFRVAHAAGSEHALTLVRDLLPQAVVLDVERDASSALSLLARIRAANPCLPVILLAEEGNTELAMFGIELGAADVLGKPADVDHFANRVRSIIAGGAAAPREKTIAELMVPASAYERVYDDEPVKRVIELLARSLFQATPGKLTERGRRTVLVYSRKEAFLGCIRVNDILDLLTPAPGKRSSLLPEAGMFVARCKVFGSITAGELIGEQCFVDVSAPLVEAVELMAADNLINIPVLKAGELVGMLPDRNVLLEACNLVTGGSRGRSRSGSSAASRRPLPRNGRTRRRGARTTAVG